MWDFEDGPAGILGLTIIRRNEQHLAQMTNRSDRVWGQGSKIEEEGDDKHLCRLKGHSLHNYSLDKYVTK